MLQEHNPKTPVEVVESLFTGRKPHGMHTQDYHKKKKRQREISLQNRFPKYLMGMKHYCCE